MRWDVSKHDADLIYMIVEKVEADLRFALTLEMSMTLCHLNGCELDLEGMLERGLKLDLVHDVYGIHRNLCRDTGKLLNLFSPRFAKRK